MPNSEPIQEYAYGSRQKRIENLNALVEFLKKWKETNPDLNTSQKVVESESSLDSLSFFFLKIPNPEP